MHPKYVIKFGQSGDLVFLIQEALKIKQDGVFGHSTKEALRQFQIRHKLKPDSIVGPLTWLKFGLNPLEVDADTDITSSATWIKQYNLPENEYVNEVTSKKTIFISSNNGQHSPYEVIDHWAEDQRGRVGAHYVIGGLPTYVDTNKLSNKDSEYDGLILQAIKDEFRGYHLGKVRSRELIKKSISVELCSAGFLKENNGKYFTWYNQEVHPSQVIRLDSPYRGHRYFHKYSEEQIDSLKAILKLLCNKHDIVSGNYFKDIKYLENLSHIGISGILSRDHVRRDSISIFPQKELLNIMNDL